MRRRVPASVACIVNSSMVRDRVEFQNRALVSSQLSFPKSASGYEFAERASAKKKKKTTPAKFRVQQSDCLGASFAKIALPKKNKHVQNRGFFF